MGYLADQIVYLIGQSSKLLKTLKNTVFQKKKNHLLTDFKKALTLDHHVIFYQPRQTHPKWSEVSMKDNKKKFGSDFIEISILSGPLTTRKGGGTQILSARID